MALHMKCPNPYRRSGGTPAVAAAEGVRETAHDDASVIDPRGNGAGRARDVEGGEAAPLPQKAVVSVGAVRVLAHDGASVIDPEGNGVFRARDLNGDEAAPLPQKAVVSVGAVRV